MQVNSSAKRMRWHTAHLDWPIERVQVEVHVRAQRTLHILEWVLLRLLDEFKAESPTMTEAAITLEIGDPVFLAQSANALAEVGALISTLEEPTEFSDWTLTDLGQTLLREGKAATLPECHGLTIFFDAITRSSLHTVPRLLRDTPNSPVVPPGQIKSRRDHIGMNVLRETATSMDVPFLTEDSTVESARVVPELGGHVWQQVSAGIYLDADGVIHAELESECESRREWFARYGLRTPALSALNAVTTDSWNYNGSVDAVEPDGEPEAIPFSKWKDHAATPIEPNSVARHACEWVASATQEILVHHRWLSAPQLELAMTKAAAGGVRCFVIGAHQDFSNWYEPEGTTPGFIAGADVPESPHPFFLIVDGQRGITVDRVCAISAGKNAVIEIAAEIKPEVVQRWHSEIIGQRRECRSESEHEVFASLAFTHDLGFWHRGVRLIAAEEDAVDKARRLINWGRWGQALFPDGPPPGGWFQEALDSWWVALEVVGTDIDERLLRVFDSGANVVNPAQVLTHATKQITTTESSGAAEVVSLLRYGGAVQQKWTSFDPARQCSLFANTIAGAVMAPGSAGVDTHAVSQRIDATIEPANARAQLKQTLAACLPRPSNIASLIAYLEAHAPLLSVLGPSFTRNVRAIVSSLGSAIRRVQSDNEGQFRGLQRLGRDLGLPDDLWPTQRINARQAQAQEHQKKGNTQ